MSLFRRSLVVLDTETTGFPAQDWAQVIELAGVMLDEEGEEIGAFERLIFCKPPPAADKALSINGITQAGYPVTVDLASGITIYGLLEARGAYAPTAQEVFTITLEVEQE